MYIAFRILASLKTEQVRKSGDHQSQVTVMHLAEMTFQKIVAVHAIIDPVLRD